MIDDYFLLFHGNSEKHSDALDINKTINDDTFFEISALILSIKHDNFEKILALESFQELVAQLSFVNVTNLETLYHLQYSVIEHLLYHRNSSNIQHFHTSLEYLNKNSILSLDDYTKLISLFDPQNFKNDESEGLEFHKQAEIVSEDFNTQKAYLITVIHELKNHLKESSALERIEEYLNKQKFSIGITGVMNAGKSTMLNALMGKEVLGTNVIPETANLSIVKYSQNEYAKVSYWNEQEWGRIEHSAQSTPAIATFVEEVHTKFSDTLDTYITKVSKVEDINLDELSEYTSASSQSSVYQLVKSVEIGTELSFLKNGIEIVDTPGLDDIVVQREEITKEYVSECDLMIHLMNVSQSATLKDVEFIIDSLLYQNISQILIVITRADTVSKKELDEVIAYTKASIKKHLQEQNSDAQFDYIIDNIHFIALSGKMALLHRTGRSEEALSEGFSLEKTGILEVEEYLHETLFSQKNERSKRIIQTSRKNLKQAIDGALNFYYLELSMLSKNENELEDALEELAIQKKSELEKSARLRSQIHAYEEELLFFINTQENHIDNEIKRLEDIIKDRIVNEARYSFEKEKCPPQERRLKKIVDDALRHGLLDIVREFRYKFLKQAKKVVDAISAQHQEFISDDFSVDVLFTAAFEKSYFNSNYDALVKRLQQLFSTSSLSKLSVLDAEVKKLIVEELYQVQSSTKEKVKASSKELLEEFFKVLKMPLVVLEETFEKKEALIKEHIEKLKNDEASRAALSIEMSKTIKTIELIVKRCY